MEFGRQRPSAETLRWVERSVGPAARVVAWRRMTGGIMSAVHRLTIDNGGRRTVLVLRQYEQVPPFAGIVRQEAATLAALRSCGLLSPALVAIEPDGTETDGRPTLLMTRRPGRVELTPDDPDSWLAQMARMAVRIHEAKVPAPPYQRWFDPAKRPVPSSAIRPSVWKEALRVLREPHELTGQCLVHRDFQHFNMLWQRGRLTGVVDWSTASMGPADVDAGHCRLNLAVLFGVDRAEQFRLAYEAESGRPLDSWWDVHAIVAYDDDWPAFIPIQVAGRVSVDADGMTGRVEDLLTAALNRL